ncbi:MAG: tyrosine-type recombinase/integrase [Deltaproteobacteria bacterium]
MAPIIGALSMRTVARGDLERVVRHLDDQVIRGEIAWKTAQNVWAVVTRMFRDACRSKSTELRVRDDNPARDVEGTDRGAVKTKAYLYPSEFLQLVGCEAVDVRWRRWVACAVYTFTRESELAAMEHPDVDVVHGVAHVHQQADREGAPPRELKTDEGARRFNVEPELLPLLRAMHDAADGEGRLFPELPDRRHVARWLKTAMRTAGLTRRELYTSTATRRAMRFHDLRSTGITWCAIRGDDPLKIQRRAGHTSLETTQEYIREAEVNREGFGEVFPPLPASVWTGIGPKNAGSSGITDGGAGSRTLAQLLRKT